MKIKKSINEVKSWFKESIFKNLVKNTGILFAGNVVASVFAFITYSLAVNALGTESFGILVVIQTYVLVINTLVNFQAWQALIKFGADSFERKKDDEFKGHVKQAFLLDTSSAILGTIIAISCAYFIGNLLDWDNETVRMAMFFSIVIIFTLIGTPTGILRLFDKFKLLAIQKIVASGLRLIAVLIAFLLNCDLWIFVIVWVISEILGNILLIFFGFYVLRENKIHRWWKSSIKNFKAFFSFTFWTNITSTIGLPVRQLDIFIVSAIIGYQGVAVYKILKEVAKIIGQISDPIYQAVYPQFAKMISKRKITGAIKYSLKIGSIILLVTLPIAIVVAATSPWWLDIFFGKEFAESWLVLSVYLMLQVISTSFIAIHPLFVVMGYVRKNFIILAIANSCFLLFAWFIGSRIGLMGVVLAFGIQFSMVILAKIFYIFRGIKEDGTRIS